MVFTTNEYCIKEDVLFNILKELFVIIPIIGGSYKQNQELRKEHDMAQADPDKILQVSSRSVGFYESGNRDPDTDTLKKLSATFNCSIDYLLCKANKRKWDTETIAFSTVSVDGSDEDEIEHIRGLIELLKRKHGK